MSRIWTAPERKVFVPKSLRRQRGFIMVAGGRPSSAPAGGGGGTFSHGNTATVTGTGFGTKSGSTPSIFDQCTAAVNTIDNQWSGGWPDSLSGNNNMQLQNSGFRSISAPHARTSKFYAGCHAGLNSLTGGNNVMLYKAFTAPSFPYYVYLSGYIRYDPNWGFNTGNIGNGGTLDNNNKTWDFSNGSTPYTQNGSTDSNFYGGYANQGSQDVNGYWGATINDDGGSLQNLDTNGHNFFWLNPVDSPYTAWRKWELEIKVSNTNGGGYIKWWQDNVLFVDYLGATDKYTGTSKTIAIGGYARVRDTNNFRYFADLAHDRQTTGAARLVLTDNATYASSTLIEYQKFTSWSSTSIDFTVNRGALSLGTVHLHFRCPVNGNQYLGTRTLV
jgi:hypothetical protein